MPVAGLTPSPGLYRTGDAPLPIAAHPTLSTGLLGYWKLEETIGARIDFVGSNDLVAFGAPGARAGKVGPAIDLNDAAAQYVSGAHYQGAIGTGAYSVSVWIYADDLSHANANWGAGFIKNGTVSSGVDVAGAFMAAVTATGQLYFWNWGHQARVSTVGAPITVGAWHHVVLRWNDSEAAIFVDGAFQARSTDGATSSGWGAGFEIGRTFTAASYYWDGGIDEVGVWKRALALAEISDLYNNGAGLPFS